MNFDDRIVNNLGSVQFYKIDALGSDSELHLMVRVTHNAYNSEAR